MNIAVEYVYWQYVLGPRWLATFLWNVQRYLWRYFSVPFMVRTLFSYWRKDSVARGGPLDQVLMSYVWNAISRGLGAIVRALVLATYLGVAAGALAVSVVTFVLFVLWPFIILLGGMAGLAILFGGGGY